MATSISSLLSGGVGGSGINLGVFWHDTQTGFKESFRVYPSLKTITGNSTTCNLGTSLQLGGGDRERAKEGEKEEEGGVEQVWRGVIEK